MASALNHAIENQPTKEYFLVDFDSIKIFETEVSFMLAPCNYEVLLLTCV